VLQGGVVGGVVLEQLSGVPLARSRVRLDRVDATGRVQSETVIAGRSGQFTFSGVPDGLYVLTASRDGYAPIAFGQRRSQGTGPAFAVNKETNLFAELRLRKLGVLTGRVLDENRIGIRRVGVSAYSTKPPFRSVATAESDDRGVFRIHGLAEGRYRLRSQPFRHDDGMPLLATFAPEMLILRDSVIYSTGLDRETTDVDVTPMAGNLISVGGAVTCAPVASSDGFVTVTLSTETGRRQTRAVCNGSYQFDNLGPGNFEVFGAHSDGKLGAFHEQRIFQSTKNAQLDLRPIGETNISVRDETGRIALRTQVMLTMRRVDAAGVAETKTFPVEERASIPLAPGWWEVAGRMAAPYYLSGANLYFRENQPRPTADPDWFEVHVVDRGTSVLLRASNQAGSVAGKVVEKQQGVAAIPVFLWPVGTDTRRKAGGPRVSAANAAGEFRFEALPPGDYRVMASFDYDEVDDDVILAANALLVKVEPSGVARAELAPYLAP
jgi:uncharacterized protein (DUF2141 family)